MKEINLIPGENDDGASAFDREKMREHGIDSMALSEALAERLRPFAHLLNNGRGVAVVIRQTGKASLIGISTE